jgi:hypothetical protein
VTTDAGSCGTVVLQLAFWPPDKAIFAVAKRAWAPRLNERIAVLELAVLQIDRNAGASPAAYESSIYPCTYPGCARGAAHPMESATQLANHRFAAHGIRSTNEQSIKRQERRDKHRAQELGAAPEYIDRTRIRSQIGALYPVTTQGVKSGALNPGEREYVRKRLANFIAIVMPREVRRAPAEICIAIAEIAASALTPAYAKVTAGHKADITMERLTQLYTKSAIAV